MDGIGRIFSMDQEKKEALAALLAVMRRGALSSGGNDTIVVIPGNPCDPILVHQGTSPPVIKDLSMNEVITVVSKAMHARNNHQPRKAGGE